MDSEYNLIGEGSLSSVDEFINDKGNRVQRRGNFEKACFAISFASGGL